jgi:UDP-N-acetyl-D-mannosaminuronic acid dehydrogenase
MKYDICVIGGAGRVGLPLSILLALSGFETLIYDINVKSVNIIREGKFPFKEENGEVELKKAIQSEKMFFTEDPGCLLECDNIIIAVDTPSDDHLNPDFSLLNRIKRQYFNFFSSNHNIILRSTVFPGFCHTLKRELENSNIFCDISFCPERIAEGNAFKELRELPQIISSFTKKGVLRSEKIFSTITKHIVKVSVQEAELAKLFNNVYRYVKFACSNQFYTIANDMGIDFYNVYKAATYNYPRAADMPKAGFSAGPCLYKDTLKLSKYCRENFFIGNAAIDINENLPMYVVRRLNQKYELWHKKILILGMGFKKESDNLKESLAVRLKRILQNHSQYVFCHDPYIEKYIQKDIYRIIEDSDIIIIGAPHNIFLDYPLKDKFIVDIWDFMENGVSLI